MNRLRAERDDALDTVDHLTAQLKGLRSELSEMKSEPPVSKQVSEGSLVIEELRRELAAVQARAAVLEDQQRQKPSILEEYAMPSITIVSALRVMQA